MVVTQFLKIPWASLQGGSRVVFRALGLNLIIVGLRSARHLAVGKGYNEPTKIAISKSRKVALLRALIHIVPVSVALWEIIFNWNTYYVGSTIQNQALYDFGAKLHEMAAQASIAAVVYSFLRYEMSLGQGLPFGALFSGLQVSQVSYLWSMEFWASVCSTNLLFKRKIGMIATIITATLLGATVGPSSAILLIPRLEYWPAGSTDVWINVTSSELWPDITNGSSIPLACQVSDLSHVDSECPSNGWQAIKNYLDFTSSLAELSSQMDVPITESPSSVELNGENSLRRLRIIDQLDERVGYDTQTWVATTQQAAVADALTATGTMWNGAVSNVTTKGHCHPEDQLDAIHSITQDYYQPYTIVSCHPDVINGVDDQRPVGFPLPPGSSPSMLNVSAFNDSIFAGHLTSPYNETLSPTHAFEFSGITRSELLDTPGPPNENRLRWVELPQNPFNGTAIGAVVLLPSAQGDTTQQIIVCNLGAGWGTSRMNTSNSTGAPQQMLSEVGVNPKAVYPDHNNVSASSGTPSSESLALGANAYFILPAFPQHTVTVTGDWAAYLNPSIPSMNTTLFHHLMTSNLSSMASATIILPSLLVNGLSSIGSTSKLQGTVKKITRPDGSSSIDGNYWFSGRGNMFEVDPSDSKDWVKFHVSSVFQGYAYNTRGVIPKFAICVLLLYCAFAIGHILYSGISGISSTCWDSIAEVTALAVNSPPTKALRNTCAGITEFDIFKLPVRILTMRDDEGDGEHLELVFGDVDEKSVEHRILKANRVYGTMPSMKSREKTQ